MAHTPDPNPSIASSLVYGLVEFAASTGADRTALLEAGGLVADDLADPDSRIPLEAYRRTFEAACRLTGDPALALHWGEKIDMADVSVVGMIMNASATMGEAFVQLQRYTGLGVVFGTEGDRPRFHLVSEDDSLWLVDDRLAPNAFPELTETTFARLTCGPRRFLDKPHVLEAHFTHAEPDYSEVYDAVFDCPVRFSCEWNALKLHPDLATWPVRQLPDYVLHALTPHADALMKQLSSRRDFRSHVEREVVAGLQSGAHTAEAVAKALNMSRQTLHRRLGSEGASYSVVLDGVREALALSYLHDGQSITETAYLLGYADPAAFSRAFKRWKGLSPTDWVRLK
jgi:AraC-like DNA-binding protein